MRRIFWQNFKKILYIGFRATLHFQSQQKIFTYFGVLRYVASFKGAELQFSRILIGFHEKLLKDPTKIKLLT